MATKTISGPIATTTITGQDFSIATQTPGNTTDPNVAAYLSMDETSGNLVVPTGCTAVGTVFTKFGAPVYAVSDSGANGKVPLGLGTGIKFDGTNDYFQTAAHVNSLDLGTNDAVWEAWIAPSASGFSRNIISNSNNMTDAGWCLYTASGQFPKIYISDGAGHTINLASTRGIATGSHRIRATWTFSTATATIAVDDETPVSATAVGMTSIISVNKTAIGVDPVSNVVNVFVGHMDDLRVTIGNATNNVGYVANSQTWQDAAGKTVATLNNSGALTLGNATSGIATPATINSTGVSLILNQASTGTNQLLFERSGVKKWTLYSYSGDSAWEIYNEATGGAALTINGTTNNIAAVADLSAATLQSQSIKAKAASTFSFLLNSGTTAGSFSNTGAWSLNGNTLASAAHVITGTTDTTQLKIVDNPTQTTNPFQIFQSDGTTNVASITNSGLLTLLGNLNSSNVITGSVFDTGTNARVTMNINGSTDVTGRTADGAGAISVKLNSAVTFANTTAKLVSIQNNGTEKLTVYKDGQLVWQSNTAHDLLSYDRGTGSAIPLIRMNGTTSPSLDLRGDVTDGVGVIGTRIDTTTTLANATSKLLSIQNNGSEKAYVGFDGVIASVGAAADIVSGRNFNVPNGQGLGATSIGVSIFPSRTVNGRPTLLGLEADGGTAVGATIDTNVAYSNTAAKLLSVKNNNVEKLAIYQDGAISLAGTPPSTAAGFGYNGSNVISNTPSTKGFIWTVAAGTVMALDANNLTVSDNLICTGSIKPTSAATGAATLVNVLRGTYVIDFGAFTAGVNQTSAQTLTGVALGDCLTVGTSIDMSATIGQISAQVTSAGNIKIVVSPITTASTADPASCTYTVTAFRSA